MVVLAGVVFVVVRQWRPLPKQDVQEEVVSTAGKDKQAVRAQVIAFGEQLQNVSLTSPTVASDIQRLYAPYLTNSLLSSWVSHPDRAAGRETSSPWPASIDPIEITLESNDSFTVRAMVVLMTSEEVVNGGDAGSQTIEMNLIKESGIWKINEYSVVRTNRANMPLSESDIPQLE